MSGAAGVGVWSTNCYPTRAEDALNGSTLHTLVVLAAHHAR